MDEADRAENAAITRFHRLERLWRDIAEAASRADAVLRLESVLAHPTADAPRRTRR